MQGQSYQEFAKLSKDQQYEAVIQQKQGQPTPLPALCKFPEMDFTPLTSTQEKKPIKLMTYRYPAENPKGVVIFFHSMGLHVGLAANMAKVLAGNGFVFVGYDQRGHGKSEGERAYLDDAKLIQDDAHKFISSVVKIYPNLPIFLMGHGGGALFALVFSQ